LRNETFHEFIWLLLFLLMLTLLPVIGWLSLETHGVSSWSAGAITAA
jgi:hypothetical protein